MKKLLLSSVVVMFAIMPAFADTVTTLPSNALCNETNLGTESGSADIEVVWTPNTITTQWFTGYGANGTAANATTCEYGGTINLPATNPSRPGYAFNGWKLRTPTVSSNPLANLDTSIEPTDFAAILFDESAEPDSQTVASYGLTNPGTMAATFSYGDIYMEASCNSTSVSGGDFLEALADIHHQYYPEYDEQKAQLIANFNYVTRPSNTFSRGSNGDVCWCRVYGYKPTNGTLQSTPDAEWMMVGNLATSPTGYHCSGNVCEDVYDSCNTACLYICAELTYGSPTRAVLYGQQ